MTRLKLAGAVGALVGSALIGGTLISSALAGLDTTTTTGSAAGASANLGGSDAYVETYLDTLASELGVDRADLGDAALAAATAAIDAAVEAGDIDEDRAAALKEALSTLDDPATILLGRGALGPHGPGHHHLGVAGGVDAAASALGIDVRDLVERMRDGSSLMEIADEAGVDYNDVVTAVTDAVEASLATAVENGRISQDRADEVMATLSDWLDEGGQPGEAGFGLRFGPGRWRGGPGWEM